RSTLFPYTPLFRSELSMPIGRVPTARRILGCADFARQLVPLLVQASLEASRPHPAYRRDGPLGLSLDLTGDFDHTSPTHGQLPRMERAAAPRVARQARQRQAREAPLRQAHRP